MRGEICVRRVKKHSKLTTDLHSTALTAQFCSHIKHRKTTPLWWACANAETKIYVNSKQAMHQFLLDYRTTPHMTTGVPPATILFGRSLSSEPNFPTFLRLLKRTLPFNNVTQPRNRRWSMLTRKPTSNHQNSKKLMQSC